MVEGKATPRPIPEEQRESATARIVARRDRLNAFFDDFDELVSPYMNHHQKHGS
jgi:hypothetical protein